jgi:RNA 3'-terminal phosphate cyclase (ATP)
VAGDKEKRMLTIDGSYGEGGGQVLRTSLSLSAITGTTVRIIHIRAGRKNAGLAAQHLTAVRAAAAVCGGSVEGDRLGSQELTFRPGDPRGGEYVFDVADIRPSAGSVNLMLETCLPVLARCSEPSRVTLRGGTHVSWSPTFEYVAEAFLPALAEFGLRASVRLNRAGYYPKGNGEEVLEVEPCGEWRGADFSRPRGGLRCRLVSRTTRLPEHVGERQMKAMRSALGGACAQARETCDQVEGIAAGTTAMVSTEPGLGGWAGCTALGAIGKKAETVGQEAAEAFRAFIASGGAVDRHLADQLLIYAALAEGTTILSVEEMTEHARTNIWVIEQFLGPTFDIEEVPGHPPTITVAR